MIDKAINRLISQ